MRRKDTYSEVSVDYNNGEGFIMVDAWRPGVEGGKSVAAIHAASGDVLYIEPEARFSKRVQKAIDEKVREIKAETKEAVARILFGKTSVRAYFDAKGLEGEQRKAALRDAVDADHSLICTTFATRGELKAYYKGIEDGDGWEKYCTVQQEDYDTMKKMEG